MTENDYGFFSFSRKKVGIKFVDRNGNVVSLCHENQACFLQPLGVTKISLREKHKAPLPPFRGGTLISTSRIAQKREAITI